MRSHAFHLEQIISTVLGQVDHDGRHGNAARTPIRGETSESDHTQKRRSRHSAIKHKSFGYSEVLQIIIWFRDGAFRGGHW